MWVLDALKNDCQTKIPKIWRWWPQGLGGVDRVWTLCALPALRSRKSSTAKAGVCETRLRKMMMTMMMIMTTAMSMTVHVLKVNNLQQMLNQKYLLYKVITSNQSWQRKYRVGRWFLNGFHFLIFYLAHSLCWNGCDQCSTHQSFFGRFQHLEMIYRSDPPSTQ